MPQQAPAFQIPPARSAILMPERKRRRAPKIILGVLIVVLILAGGAGFAAYNVYGQAKELQSQANGVMNDVSSIKSSISSNQFDTAAQSAVNIKTTVASMQETLDSPLWSFVEGLPTYGQDVKGVKSVLQTLYDVSDDALVPLTQALQETPISSLVQNKQLNITAMDKLLDTVESVAPAMETAAVQLESMPEFHLDQLKGPMEKASQQFIEINELYQQVSDLAPIAGTLLGGEGQRQYLVVAQNSAETRSTGGFPGAMGLLVISNGSISMSNFETARDALTDETPAEVAPTQTELALFTDLLQYSRDFGFIPDFERTSHVWQVSYEQNKGTHLDGVIGVTPSVVQKILAIAGPITLADGTTLDGTNATRVLEHDLYWKYLTSNFNEGNQIVDALFADAADQAFHKLFENLDAGRVKKIVKMIFGAIDTREVMFVMTDPAEQAQMEPLAASGGLNDDPAQPEIGVFVNYTIGSKLGWYLDENTVLGQGTKNADGTTTYAATTTLSNVVTPDEAASGGPYIMGGGYGGLAQGEMGASIFLAAPFGGSITDFNVQGRDPQIYEDVYEDLQFIRIWDYLGPQETVTLTYNVTVAAQAQEPPKVTTMPLLTEYRNA